MAGHSFPVSLGLPRWRPCQSPDPGATLKCQNPYPGEGTLSQFPVGSPPLPPWRLTLIGALYVYFVFLLGFEGEIVALEAKLKELNEKEAEFTDAIEQQEGKIESVKMEFAPQQNALDKRQEEIEEREKTIQQEYVSNETPTLGVYWAAVR